MTPPPQRLTAQAASLERQAEGGAPHLWLEAAEAWWRAGHLHRATSALDRAEGAAQPERVRALQLRIRCHLGDAHAAQEATQHEDPSLRTEGLLALQRPHDIAAAVPPHHPLRSLLCARAALALGDLRDARRLATQATRDARARQDALAEGEALTLLGRALVEQHDYHAARTAHRSALDLHRAHGCVAGMAASLGGLGLCDVATGHGLTARGAQHLTQAAALARDVGQPLAEAAWLTHLERAWAILQRTDQRLAVLARLREIVTTVGDPSWEASLWESEASCWIDLKDAPRATAAAERAQQLRA